MRQSPQLAHALGQGRIPEEIILTMQDSNNALSEAEAPLNIWYQILATMSVDTKRGARKPTIHRPFLAHLNILLPLQRHILGDKDHPHARLTLLSTSPDINYINHTSSLDRSTTARAQNAISHRSKKETRSKSSKNPQQRRGGISYIR